MDNIKMWTGLSVEESVRMTEDTEKMEKVRPWCGQRSDRGRLKEQNRIADRRWRGDLTETYRTIIERDQINNFFTVSQTGAMGKMWNCEMWNA